MTETNEAILFTNYSNEDFSHSWDGSPYLFKAGGSIYLPTYLAKHFARHLAQRELNRDNKAIGGIILEQEMAKSLVQPTTAPESPTMESASTPERAEIEVINKNKKLEKEGKKGAKKKEEKEVEFEDIN